MRFSGTVAKRKQLKSNRMTHDRKSSLEAVMVLEEKQN